MKPPLKAVGALKKLATKSGKNPALKGGVEAPSDQKQERRAKKIKLTIVSPLPPRRSGISDYTAELIPYLAQIYDLVVVVETSAEAEGGNAFATGWTVLGASDPAAETRLRNSVIIYQLGNNPDHAFVYDLCMRIPGIVVLHDFVLHHLIEAMTLVKGQTEPYLRILEREYGPSGVALGRLRRIGYFGEEQKFLMPLSRHVSRRAKAMIVHSEYVARRLGWPLDPRVSITHHHFSPQADHILAGRNKTESRDRLSLPKDRFIFLSLGFVTRPKKPDLVFAALRQLKERGFDFLYMMVGHCGEKEWVQHHLDKNGLTDNDVKFAEYVEEDAFFEYINASDALISLRYPTAGESSGTLTRAMGLGLPSVVFDYGPMAEIPEGVVESVRFVRDEKLLIYRLADALEKMISQPDTRLKIGEAGRAYVRQQCTVQNTLDVYASVVARMVEAGEDLPSI